MNVTVAQRISILHITLYLNIKGFCSKDLRALSYRLLLWYYQSLYKSEGNTSFWFHGVRADVHVHNTPIWKKMHLENINWVMGACA